MFRSIVDKCAIAVWLSALLLSPTASAQSVSYYNVFKFQQYTQTTAAPPTAASVFYCNFGVDLTTSDAITGGTVTWPPTPVNRSVDLTFAGTDNTSRWSYWSPGPQVSTKGDLDSWCPVTDYVFALSGGTLGDVQATFTLAADAYSASVPALDPMSFQALAAALPGADVTLTTVPHPPGAGVSYSATYVRIDDATTGMTVTSASNDTGMNDNVVSLAIPADTLSPARGYRLSVIFTDRVNSANPGFGAGTTAFTAFDQTTVVEFQTLLADGGVPDDAAVDAPRDAPDDVTADVTGDVADDVTGDVTGDVSADVTGDVVADATVDGTADAGADARGDVALDATADVTGDVHDAGGGDADAPGDGSTVDVVADAGTGLDVGATVSTDAGAVPANTDSGCKCSAVGAASSTTSVGGLLMPLWWVAAARRRARRWARGASGSGLA